MVTVSLRVSPRPMTHIMIFHFGDEPLLRSEDDIPVYMVGKQRSINDDRQPFRCNHEEENTQTMKKILW